MAIKIVGVACSLRAGQSTYWALGAGWEVTLCDQSGKP